MDNNRPRWQGSFYDQISRGRVAFRKSASGIEDQGGGPSFQERAPDSALEQFLAECETTENQHTITNTVESGSMVFPQKKLASPLQVRGESLP